MFELGFHWLHGTRLGVVRAYGFAPCNLIEYSPWSFPRPWKRDGNSCTRLSFPVWTPHTRCTSCSDSIAGRPSNGLCSPLVRYSCCSVSRSPHTSFTVNRPLTDRTSLLGSVRVRSGQVRGGLPIFLYTRSGITLAHLCSSIDVKVNSFIHHLERYYDLHTALKWPCFEHLWQTASLAWQCDHHVEVICHTWYTPVHLDPGPFLAFAPHSCPPFLRTTLTLAVLFLLSSYKWLLVLNHFHFPHLCDSFLKGQFLV